MVCCCRCSSTVFLLGVATYTLRQKKRVTVGRRRQNARRHERRKAPQTTTENGEETTKRRTTTRRPPSSRPSPNQTDRPASKQETAAAPLTGCRRRRSLPYPRPAEAAAPALLPLALCLGLSRREERCLDLPQTGTQATRDRKKKRNASRFMGRIRRSASKNVHMFGVDMVRVCWGVFPAPSILASVHILRRECFRAVGTPEKFTTFHKEQTNSVGCS